MCPSRPKIIRPPLWLGSGSSMRSTSRALPGSALSALARWYSQIASLPLFSV